jgi:transposase
LQRYQLRQTEAVPLLKGLKKWLGESVRDVPPKSSLRKAIDYALKQWPYLEAYGNHGEIEIDNNLIENQIRPFALGRKNSLFVGNFMGCLPSAVLQFLQQAGWGKVTRAVSLR